MSRERIKPNVSRSEFRIGEVSALTGVSVDTVRYYERRLLLPLALRTPGGYRVFTQETIERLRFIREAQEIGFSLNEIMQLFLTRGSVYECQNVQNLLLRKLKDLEKRMTQIRAFKKILGHHLAMCEAELKTHGDEAACPVLPEVEKSYRQKK